MRVLLKKINTKYDYYLHLKNTSFVRGKGRRLNVVETV